MKIRTIFGLYLRARIWSWLHSSTQGVYVFLSSMERAQLASFTNGCMDQPGEFPDTLPDEWSKT
jgi:hypothetical protein